MNYCFRCGVKILDKNQNFCIECGANLAEHDRWHANYEKDCRKKFNPMPGESYIDYLNRITLQLLPYPLMKKWKGKAKAIGTTFHMKKKSQRDIILLQKGKTATLHLKHWMI